MDSRRCSYAIHSRTSVARQLARLLLLPLAGTVLTGGICSSYEPTLGELGRAKLQWGECNSVVEDCAVTQALAAGARASLMLVNAHELPDLEVSVRDGELLEVSWDASKRLITLEALRAGETMLVLTDRVSGEVVDRLSLRIAEVAIVEMVAPETAWRLAVMTGGPIRAGFQPKDDQAKDLRGIGALDYVSSPGLTLQGAPRQSDRGGYEEATFTVAPAAKSETLEVRGGAVSRTLVVTLPAPGEAARVEIGSTSTTLDDYPRTVSAAVFLASGVRVYRPVVSWQSSDPTCIAVSDEVDPRVLENAQFAAMASLEPRRIRCAAQITATIGEVSASQRFEVR